MTNEEINEAVAKALGVDGFHRINGNPVDRLNKPIPDYCTDISAAWEIVEQPELWVNVTRMLNREFGSSTIYTTYRCEINRNHSVDVYIGEADTAPMAICKAFLKLKEIVGDAK